MEIALILFREQDRVGVKFWGLTAWGETAPDALRAFAGQLEQVSIEERAALLPGIELAPGSAAA
jgi:hypothetical protein